MNVILKCLLILFLDFFGWGGCFKFKQVSLELFC